MKLNTLRKKISGVWCSNCDWKGEKSQLKDSRPDEKKVCPRCFSSEYLEDI